MVVISALVLQARSTKHNHAVFQYLSLLNKHRPSRTVRQVREIWFAKL